EVAYSDLPDVVTIRESIAATERPDSPERELASGASLSSYFQQPELPAVGCAPPHGCDDLHGRSFRILKDLAGPMDLPVRLSPQQQRIVDAPLPLLVQGVAGSGKTTILAHFAFRQLARKAARQSVLIVTYTEELRRFTQALLAAIDDTLLMDLET